jgi:hypothetical protein
MFLELGYDSEHDYYNSFTLCRGCTWSPWVVIIPGSWIPVVETEYPYTLPRCMLENHYKAFQLFPLACNVPTEVSPPVWALQPSRSPLLCLMVSSHCSFTHTFPRFSHCSFTKHPSVQPSQLSRTAGWYAKTSLYHILRQAIPIEAHGCTVFMCGCSMNQPLDLGMITNHRLPRSHQTKP